ncbi:HNH endonuclease [Pyxidicoccus fallax]|uniref:HNH nuclease domain-containing protein n=2 Tax=Pyxidicoccus fallax TaxID=394095 RepID=A0A848LAQ8_9BACT|nr:HNH endonuclease [Pyxidicoccus fallax]NMO15989.1 hypothetical protein [Pyxidicoccus fallax]
MQRLAEVLPPFDPRSLEDGRSSTLVSLIRRQGQGMFRQDLLGAYDGRCALTGCGVPEVLEAAHLIPYRGRSTNHPRNGVLLRSDLHALFDQRLLSFDGRTYRARLDPSLKGTEYEELDGRKLRLPRERSLWPDVAALARRTG